MIASIKGIIENITPAEVVLECSGIGYQIRISLPTYEKIKEKKELKLSTYLQVKEDAHTLFGFIDPKEKEMFLLLISISGIGAITALNILSATTIKEIHTAILHEDAVALSRIKGIGAKTAQRVILELKDKISELELEQNSLELKGFESSHNIVQEEALQALITLGFTKGSAQKAISKILKKNTEAPVEEIIRMALKGM